MKIFPNPVRNGKASLVFESNVSENAWIYIYDELGRKTMMEKEYSINSGRNIIELDLSKLVKGVYFVSFNTTDNVITKQIVKD